MLACAVHILLPCIQVDAGRLYQVTSRSAMVCYYPSCHGYALHLLWLTAPMHDFQDVHMGFWSLLVMHICDILAVTALSLAVQRTA